MGEKDKDCSQCTRRKFYQVGYEDGKRENINYSTYKAKTRADKIREMSDEELADIFAHVDDVNEGYWLKEAWLKWL